MKKGTWRKQHKWLGIGLSFFMLIWLHLFSCPILREHSKDLLLWLTLGVSCLESYSAGLLQDGEIVADCIKCKTSLVQAKVHVLTDKLLVKLTECHIVSSITLLDEQSQCQAGHLSVCTALKQILCLK